MPVSTTEALAVFILALLPGLLARAVIGYGAPSLRSQGTLADLANALALSLLVWAALYPLESDSLVRVLSDERPVKERLDSFVDLTTAAVLVSLGIGVAGRLRRFGLRWVAKRSPPSKKTRVAGLARTIHASAVNQAQPASGWDRMLVQLTNDYPQNGFLCVVDTRSGARRYGLITDLAYLDWQADGRDVLLSLEFVPDATGKLESLQGSRGLFVPGDEVSALAVFELSN